MSIGEYIHVYDINQAIHRILLLFLVFFYYSYFCYYCIILEYLL